MSAINEAKLLFAMGCGLISYGVHENGYIAWGIFFATLGITQIGDLMLRYLNQPGDFQKIDIESRKKQNP